MEAAVTFPAPAGLDDAQAAGFVIAYQTGWFALHERARLQPGETLLVHAAAGGVGTAAVQLGKAAGARVVAVVGGPDKAEVARRCGADVVVDRHTEDVVAVVKAVTGGRGADVVFDPVGGDAYTQSTKCVAFEGRIVVVGFAERDDAVSRRSATPWSRTTRSSASTGGSTPRSTRPGCGPPTSSCSGSWPRARSPRWSASACGSTGSPRACSGSPTASRSGGSCGRRDRRPAGPGPRRPAAVARRTRHRRSSTAPLTGELIAGGKSNLTYRVSDGTTSVVVRRPPLGHVLATAHDMGREYRVISALQDTAVPVPETYAWCADESVIGAPFYVMSLVDGVPYRTEAELETLGEKRTREIGERLVDTLADLHLVDAAAVGPGRTSAGPRASSPAR